MEEASTEFQRLVAELQKFESDKLRLYHRLAPQFKELKEQYEDVELKKKHPEDAQPKGGVVSAARKIKSAETFEELETATAEFIEHPRVIAAQDLSGLFGEMKELLMHLPSAEELEALENFDTGNIKAAALKWADNVGDHALRSTVLPILDLLLLREANMRGVGRLYSAIFNEQATDTSSETSSTDGAPPPAISPILMMADAQEKMVDRLYSAIFNELATDASSETSSSDGTPPPAISPVLMVVDAQEKMEELYRLQQKQALDPGDLDRAKGLATTLCDDEYTQHLELWAGSAEDTVTTLKNGLTLLKDSVDDPTARGHLDTVFAPPEIVNSRQLNTHLTKTVEELRKASPYVQIYQKAYAKYTPPDSTPSTYADALQELVDEVAEIVLGSKKYLAPELHNEVPALVDYEDYYPPVSKSHKSATKMLKACDEIEALLELKMVSQHVADLEEHRTSSTGDEDIDPVFAPRI